MRPDHLPPVPFIAFDGYCRMTVRSLLQMQLSHVYSSHDPSLMRLLERDGLTILDAGFTEWQGILPDFAADLSVGWDWYTDATSGMLRIAYDAVRSNMMIVRTDGVDLGQSDTSRLLRRTIARTAWRGTLQSALLLSCSP